MKTVLPLQILVIIRVIYESPKKADNLVRILFEAFGQVKTVKKGRAGFDLIEAAYRLICGPGDMPPKYRSAKSLVENAISNGVKLTDARGNARSKNAVSDELAKRRRSSSVI